MQDTPTPSPSDPENHESGNSDGEARLPRKSLKLKRIVIEDTELHPESVESAESIPEAKPYEEPEEAPVPEEFRQHDDEHIPEDDSPGPKPGDPPPPEEPEPEDPLPKRENTPVKATGGTPDNLKKQPVSPARRLAFIIVPAVVLAALLLVLNQVFDPFGGGDLAPIQPQQAFSMGEQSSSQPPEAEDADAQLAISSLLEETEAPSLEAYVMNLQAQNLAASNSPRGLFIGTVFVPEGAVLNREFALRLSSITTDPSGSLVVLKTDSGAVYPLEVPTR